MKRPRPRSDIPDWRDPQMPVLREYRFADGSLRKEVDSDYERRYRSMLMESSCHIGWKQDATYERKRK